MDRYLYHCKECNKTFEEEYPNGEAPEFRPCPKCNKNCKLKAIQFSTYYVTQGKLV